MKKLTLLILMLLSPVMIFAQETSNVVVSIKPLHSLVAGVMGDTGSPQLLVSGKVSPHEFQLKPSQMSMLQNATIVFYIDPGFETFLNNAFESLPATIRRTPVAEKADLALLNIRSGGAWDTHQHQEHEAATHADYDMHVWMDPDNAKKIVFSISKELSEVYPENRAIYKQNAVALIGNLEHLNAKLNAMLAVVKDKPFIVFHDAYQYFEKKYELNAVGSITFEPDESPSPGRLMQLKEKLQQTKAQCIFREPYFSNRLIDTLREDTGIQTGILDPEGMSLEPGQDLYFQLMENLAKNIRECLG